MLAPYSEIAGDTTEIPGEPSWRLTARARHKSLHGCTFAIQSRPKRATARSLSALSVAPGASLMQTEVKQRSARPAEYGPTAFSHFQVTDWHRTVTWEMRKSPASNTVRPGGYDGHRD